MANGFFDARSLFGQSPEELQRELFDKSQQRRMEEMKFLSQNTTAPGYTYGMLQTLEPLRQQFSKQGEDPRVQQLREQVKAAQGALQGFDLRTAQGKAQAASKLMSMGMLEQGTKLLKAAEAQRRALSGGTDMTTTEKDIRDIAVNKYGVNLDDPNLPQSERARIYGLASQDNIVRKRETGKELSVNKDIEDLSKIVAPDLYKSGTVAAKVEANTIQMQNLLEKVYTGWGSEAALEAEKLLELFGVNTQAPAKEAFRSLAMNQILGFVANTKGAISDKEMEAFKSASPSLSNTRAGNKLILKVARKEAEYQRKLMDHFGKWRNENPGAGMSAWQIESSKFRRNNGYTISQAEIEAGLKKDKAQEMETVFVQAAPEYFAQKGTFKGKPAYIIKLQDGSTVMQVVTEPEDGSTVMPIQR